MSDNERLRAYMGVVWASVMEAAPYFEKSLGSPISIDEIDPQKLDQAVYAAAKMQALGKEVGMLGVIDPNAPETLLPRLERGQVVIFTIEENGKATVESPYSRKTIDSKSNIVSSIMLNVPARLIRPIISRTA
jgi:hypothetical protein